MRHITHLLAIALAVALTAAQGGAQSTFTVTGVGFTQYDIDGQSNPTLTVVRGQTYSFTLVNCAIHPFNIQSAPGIGGTRYPNVQNNGGTSGTVTLTVPIDEPADTLFYQCGNHVPMHGVINVVDPIGESTPTPTSTPVPTATPVLCVGDCNGDTSVTVDELLAMVNIALSSAGTSDCPPGDTNGDGQITVDEILAAVNNALNGCPAA
jgi:hypothetical protein